jgi:UPF0755 protein
MRRWQWVVAAAGAALAVAALAAIWVAVSLTRQGPAQPVVLEVEPGEATSTVLADLEARGLLPSAAAGRLYLAFFSRGRSIRYGLYEIGPGSRPVDVLERLLDGRVEMVTVTIVEGSTATEVAQGMAAAGLGTTADWDRLVQQRQWIADLSPDAPSLEGFLFPDTYRFAVGTPAEQAAHHLVDRFREVWQAEVRSADPLWGSTLEIVTLASLVEAETSVPEERPRVAGVFANRLRRGMLLQCDPTVVYALKRRLEWGGRLLREHLKVDDPYNTYRYPGLPPGPINSPGRAALAAAIAPEEHAYLYFVAKPGGGHTFSTNLKDHNRAVARLRRARR